MVKRIINSALILFFFPYIILPRYTYAQEILASSEYINLLQQKISSSFISPIDAQPKGLEGTTKVRFSLARDGRIKKIDIAQSSGYSLLDAMAILAVKDGGPYPFPKGYYPEQELELIVPVEFIANKSAKIYADSTLVSSDDLETPQDTVNQTPANAIDYQAIPEDTVQKTREGPKIGAGELNYFIDLSLKNHEPTKVAHEEIELAQIKVTESKRGFFPGVKVQAYNTTGEVNKIDYEEREVKTQIDQPIYYGGRLKDTLDQAKVNLEITQKNYDRLKLDVVHKTETSYYNLIAARINFKQKEALYKEAKELKEKVDKLYKVGMITPLELASARSWLEQIGFQLDSIKQEVYMAGLTFKQVLNLKEAPVVTADVLEAKKLDLNLNQCVNAAFKNRPELSLSELLVKFNKYGQKIEFDKNNAFSVDLTGSYGWYKGHFKTEPWSDAKNWFGGVKVSKPWGANTINTSYNSEHTQPRFGQTSPTASNTLNSEFNLLDNMKRLSDKKKSDVDLHRSLSDFDEGIKTIIFEVQDAFLNYQKAVIQLNTASLDIKFRTNEVEVIKTRALVGEVPVSNALESLFSLSEAQTKYIQALANYHISLATLKKASGYGLQI